MEELGEVTIELLNDRGTKKLRVNMIKGNIVHGFIRPINNSE